MRTKTRAKKARRHRLKRVGGQLSVCGGKEGYADRSVAEIVLRNMRDRPGFVERPGKVLSVYFCPCKLWHVGNRPAPLPKARGGQRKAG